MPRKQRLLSKADISLFQKKTPTGFQSGFLLVEVAGQSIHIFRCGLDYAFIRQVSDAGRIIRLRES